MACNTGGGVVSLYQFRKASPLNSSRSENTPRAVWVQLDTENEMMHDRSILRLCSYADEKRIKQFKH